MKPQRNEPCPCGSGLKYKKCCGAGISPGAQHVQAPPAAVVGTVDIDQLRSVFAAGRYAEAERQALAAVGRSATNGPAWKMLGVSLLVQGKDSLPALRRATQLLPDDAEAHANLGKSLQDRRQLADAVISYRRALAIEPEFAAVLLNLANALLDLGQAAAAVECYHRVLLIRPGNAEACCNLGRALRLQGRAAQAEVSCRRALALEPNLVAAINLLGELCADKGEFAEAESQFRRAVTLEPERPDGWIGIARYRRMTTADTSWLTSVQRLLARGLPAAQEIPLRFAVGKYFDDLQDFEQAFDSYRQANELTRQQGPRYDGRQVSQHVDRMKMVFDQDWFARARSDATTSTRPVFIVGMPRSGTSLTEQILASHPAVHGAGELRFWHEASVAHASGHPEQAGHTFSLTAAARQYLRQVTDSCGEALRVVDKMPTNFLNLGLIHAALPNARIIHVCRDPIDTCLSIYFQNYSSGFPYASDLEDLAHFYAQYRRVMQHWHATLAEGAMLDVPYEGLVQDQEAWSRRLIDFVGLQWDARCLDFHSTQRAVTSASKWQVRQKISTTSLARWRNYERFIGPLRALTRPVIGVEAKSGI